MKFHSDPTCVVLRSFSCSVFLGSAHLLGAGVAGHRGDASGAVRWDAYGVEWGHPPGFYFPA